MDLHALPDGRVVTIRPIRADDSERLQLAHQRLSPESRYRRFMASKPELTAADTRYLVDVDGCDHYALVATVAEAEADGEEIIAVARFVRLAGTNSGNLFEMEFDLPTRRDDPGAAPTPTTVRAPRLRSSRGALEADRSLRSQGQAELVSGHPAGPGGTRGSGA